MYGQSTVRALDPVTGKVQTIVEISKDIFAEGIVYYHGKLIQITWENRTGYIWDPSNFTGPTEEFTYKTTRNDEGWGITHDPNKKGELIVSDGSDKLIFWDSATFEILRTVSVTRQSGSPARYLNELQFWRDRVLANVLYEDVILVINPETGLVEKEYDFSSLWPKAERPLNTDCFNGISVSADPDVLYVTGKYWNRMYRLKLMPL
jgi:glutaminyl-peptide cyclotransferase